MNSVASYCASSADCTRSSTQTENNRDQKLQIRPYPDVITHNVDVGMGRPSNSPDSSVETNNKHPQYASVDKKSSKKSKPSNLNDQLIGTTVKHKDPHPAHTNSPYQSQVQQQQQVTYQKIHRPSSTLQYPRPSKNNETNPSSIIKPTPPKIDIIKTTYPDL